MKYIMKKNKMMLLAAACSILLLGSCGTSKNVQGSGSTSASHQKENATKGSDSRQSETLKKLAFVQKVSDNQVYTKNIVGNMSFTLQAGDKDITVPGKLSMRKDEIIRIQLFIPILGTEVGRLEFTPDHVLIIDDFLANGEAATGAIRLIRLAHATVAGVGILIEKSFQPGRQKLNDQGFEVYSLARVAKLEKDFISFIPEDSDDN